MSSNQNLPSQSTKRRVKNCLLGALFVATAAVLLINCGGGGGADSSAKSISGDGLNPGASGKFWQPDLGVGSVHYITDAKTGNTIRTLSALRDSLVSVARDGRLFVSQNVLSTSEKPTLTIRTTPKTQVEDRASNVATLTLDVEEVNDVYLSPDSRYMAVIYADGTSAVSTKNGLYIYDLQNQADVNTIKLRRIYDTGMSSTQIAAFDWLPGGEYRYIYRDNRIMAGSVTNPSQGDKPAGKIVVPAGYYAVQEPLHISPDGKQIAVVFILPKPPERTTGVRPREVWLTDISGGNAQRVTAANQADAIAPVWSPDGRFLAIAAGPMRDNSDAAAFDCKRQYILSTARNVTKENNQALRYMPYARPNQTQVGPHDMPCNPLDFYWTE
jgi:WD40 repeat protein